MPPNTSDALRAPLRSHIERPISGRKAGITDMDAANRYLEQVYMPNHNAEFALPAAEAASAFVPCIGVRLPDILCTQFERTVGNDNCVSFEGRTLQIPASNARSHYCKSRAHPFAIRRCAGPAVART
jgi:hypothetical protein